MRSGMVLTVALSLLWAGFAVAQVQISDVDRDLQTGTVVTVTGNGFGEKPNATPWMWDDLSSPAYAGLSNGDSFPTKQGTYGHPKNSNAPQQDADIYAWEPTVYASAPNLVRVPGRPVYRNDNGPGYLAEIGRPSKDYLYLDYWFYSVGYTPADQGVLGAAYNKTLRLWAGPGNGGHADSHISMRRMATTYDPGPTSADSITKYPKVALEEGRWYHIAVWVDRNGGYTFGNSNGILKIWENNAIKMDVSDVGYRDAPIDGGGDCGITWVEMLGTEKHSGIELDTPNEVRFGDIYIDDSLARVILGDAPTWNQVSHYEMQIPQDWDPSQIEFKANLGSFTTDDNIYLYVSDASGRVNSTGFQVAGDLPDPDLMPGTPGTPVY